MKIVSDIDECLVQYLGGFCDFWNNKTEDNMKFVDGAREGILKLVDNGNDVDFVTVRSDAHKYKTRLFFDRGFPGRSFDVYFEKGSKLARLRELKTDLIIEDSVGSGEYAEAGIKVILFDNEWNKGMRHENIYRCFDWDGIVDTVEELRDV